MARIDCATFCLRWADSRGLLAKFPQLTAEQIVERGGFEPVLVDDEWQMAISSPLGPQLELEPEFAEIIDKELWNLV
jgi:hypothetical protein